MTQTNIQTEGHRELRTEEHPKKGKKSLKSLFFYLDGRTVGCSYKEQTGTQMDVILGPGKVIWVNIVVLDINDIRT